MLAGSVDTGKVEWGMIRVDTVYQDKGIETRSFNYTRYESTYTHITMKSVYSEKTGANQITLLMSHRELYE